MVYKVYKEVTEVTENMWWKGYVGAPGCGTSLFTSFSEPSLQPCTTSKAAFKVSKCSLPSLCSIKIVFKFPGKVQVLGTLHLHKKNEWTVFQVFHRRCTNLCPVTTMSIPRNTCQMSWKSCQD